MTREWTDEQRAAASERAKAQWASQKTTAPSDAQMLMAQAQSTAEQVSTQRLEDVVEAEVLGDDRGDVTHTQPGKVRVYKPTPYGYKPREIPVTGLAQALDGGFLPNCPDCHGQCGDGVNDCPGREKRAYRQCPVPQCRKKVYDFIQGLDVEDADDPMKIEDDAYALSTPELRTKALMDKHMLVLHPNEAAAAGIVAPAQRTLVGAKS